MDARCGQKVAPLKLPEILENADNESRAGPHP